MKSEVHLAGAQRTCRFSIVRYTMSGFFEAAAQYDAEPGALHALIEGNPAMLGRSDTAGLTLLHYACKEGHLDAVIQLVEVRERKRKNKQPTRADLSP